MKCPKCGYLGFETTERCRHCGYDFSLSIQVDVEAATALPLRSSDDTEAPLADFDLSGLNIDIVAEPTAGLDLDRIIGRADAMPFPLAASALEDQRPVETATAVATPPPEDVQQQYPPSPSVEPESLPLFAGAGRGLDESSPLAPPPARPPLAVRRATPEVSRRRTPRTIRRDVERMGLRLEPAIAPGERAAFAEGEDGPLLASPGRRIAAAIVDLVILGGINAGVLYLTLAIAGLSVTELQILPPVPMAAFLMLLNGGYLIGFTVTNGQTIGKMLARIRVIGDQGGSIDMTGAVLRAVGAILSVALLGLPYLPMLFSNDRRALHDRLAATRVIKHA